MIIKNLLIILIILFCVSAIVVFVINLDISQNETSTIIKELNIEFQEFKNNANEYNISLVDELSGDDILETYTLYGGELAIIQEKAVLWATPSDWWVDSFVIADATNNGKKNIVLSVWKSGDYGLSKPFWVAENDLSVKNHLFVFSFRNNKIEPVWQSSNLEKPNCDFLFSDIDLDNQQELVVIEGEYGIANECQGHYLAVWKWNDWGFFNEWRSLKGDYQNIELLLPLIDQLKGG